MKRYLCLALVMLLCALPGCSRKEKDESEKRKKECFTCEAPAGCRFSTG